MFIRLLKIIKLSLIRYLIITMIYLTRNVKIIMTYQTRLIHVHRNCLHILLNIQKLYKGEITSSREMLKHKLHSCSRTTESTKWNLPSCRTSTEKSTLLGCQKCPAPGRFPTRQDLQLYLTVFMSQTLAGDRSLERTYTQLVLVSQMGLYVSVRQHL